MRPFLKWAGGKHRLAERIAKMLPPGRRLVEPFAGLVAVFLNTTNAEALLADANRDLISLYTTLQSGGKTFIEACRSLFTAEANRAAFYAARRTQFNHSTDEWEHAWLFVYLNKHCYNGLCRYRGRRESNVPFSRYTLPHFPEAEMRTFAVAAQRARFEHARFEAVMAAALPGDVIYCDPPYVPLSQTANFATHSAAGFGPAEQIRLSELAHELAQRGVPVLISNHDRPGTRALYARASQLQHFTEQRHSSCNGQGRARANEILALFLPTGQTHEP